MEETRAAKHRLVVVVAVLSLCGLTFFFGLGRIGLIGPDEPRYAEVAREMFVSGDYITPRLCGCLWFEKPVLLYWMVSLSYGLAGTSEYAARLPSALAALLTVISVYWILRRTGLNRLSIAGATVLATSAAFVSFSRATTPDMALTLAVTVALLAGYVWTTATGSSRVVYLMVFAAATGFAVLAKGLVGVALAVPILVVHLLIIEKPKSIRVRDCGFGVAVFLAVVSVWYLPVTMRHGWTFIDEFFFQHHFRRYTTDLYHHPAPFYFFPFVAIAGSLPWTFFLAPAIARLRSLRPRDEAADSLLTLAWIWVAWPIVFFSFSVSKLPGYILPIFPALAIIIGAEVERLWRQPDRVSRFASWLTALLLVSMGIALVVYANEQLLAWRAWETVAIGSPLAIAASAVALVAFGRYRASVVGAAAVVIVVVAASVMVLFPVLENRITLKALSQEAADQLRPGERIAFFLKNEYAPVFYAEGRVVCDAGEYDVLNALSMDALAETLKVEGTLIVITRSNWRAYVEDSDLVDAELIGQQGESLAYRVTRKSRIYK